MLCTSLPTLSTWYTDPSAREKSVVLDVRFDTSWWLSLFKTYMSLTDKLWLFVRNSIAHTCAFLHICHNHILWGLLWLLGFKLCLKPWIAWDIKSEIFSERNNRFLRTWSNHDMFWNKKSCNVYNLPVALSPTQLATLEHMKLGPFTTAAVWKKSQYFRYNYEVLDTWMRKGIYTFLLFLASSAIPICSCNMFFKLWLSGFKAPRSDSCLLIWSVKAFLLRLVLYNSASISAALVLYRYEYQKGWIFPWWCWSSVCSEPVRVNQHGLQKRNHV